MAVLLSHWPAQPLSLSIVAISVNLFISTTTHHIKNIVEVMVTWLHQLCRMTLTPVSWCVTVTHHCDTSSGGPVVQGTVLNCETQSTLSCHDSWQQSICEIRFIVCAILPTLYFPTHLISSIPYIFLYHGYIIQPF